MRKSVLLSALALPMLVSSIPAHAQSTALATTEAKLTPVLRIWGLAIAASQCRLRSNAWYHSIDLAVEDFLRQHEGREALSQSDRNALDTFKGDAMNSAIQSVHCSTLANSPTLAELDHIQSEITSGYH